MAVPTHYRWTDPGAPQMVRGNMPQLQAIFQACLIDGYGAKTPPVSGTNKWTIPFSDATSFILQQGGGAARKCGLKLHTLGAASGNMQCAAAVTWTDLNTPVNLWTTGTSIDRLGAGFADTTTNLIPWGIFATERTIFVAFGYNLDPELFPPATFSNSINSGTDDNGSQAYYWMFGDYAPIDPAQTHNQILVHDKTSGTTSTIHSKLFNPLRPDTLSIAGTIDNVDGIFVSGAMFNSNNFSGRTQFANTTTTVEHPFSAIHSEVEGLYVDKYRIICERAMMGEMPGMLYATSYMPMIIHLNIGSFQNGGETIYTFSDTDGGGFMLRDGEWGVD